MLHLLVRDIYRDGAGVRPRIKAQDALSQFRMTPRSVGSYAKDSVRLCRLGPKNEQAQLTGTVYSR
jgi:hypothetical protein